MADNAESSKSTRPKFELTLVVRSMDPNRQFVADSISKVVSDDFVHLLSQFMIVIVTEHRRLMEEAIRELKRQDDDIPF